MLTEDEPIMVMAQFIYETTVYKTTVDESPWDKLPESKKFYWGRVAAQSFERYWDARERRERR